MEKAVEDCIKDGLIIAVANTRIFFALKATNIKPPEASLDALDITKRAGGICGGVLKNIFQFTRNGSTSR